MIVYSTIITVIAVFIDHYPGFIAPGSHFIGLLTALAVIYYCFSRGINRISLFKELDLIVADAAFEDGQLIAVGRVDGANDIGIVREAQAVEEDEAIVR